MSNGQKYYDNLIKLNTAIFNKLKEKMPEDNNSYENNTLTAFLTSGMMESVLRIDEAIKAARQLLDTDLEVSSEIAQMLTQVKPSFYIKGDDIFSQKDIPLDDLVTMVLTFAKEKSQTKPK